MAVDRNYQRVEDSMKMTGCTIDTIPGEPPEPDCCAEFAPEHCSESRAGKIKNRSQCKYWREVEVEEEKKHWFIITIEDKRDIVSAAVSYSDKRMTNKRIDAVKVRTGMSEAAIISISYIGEMTETEFMEDE